MMIKYFLSIFFAVLVITVSAQKAGYSKIENGIIVYPVNAGVKTLLLKSLEQQHEFLK